MVGFDLDGMFLRRRGTPSVASLKGVLSDEARFEHGAPRLRLTVESVFERIRARTRRSCSHPERLLRGGHCPGLWRRDAPDSRRPGGDRARSVESGARVGGRLPRGGPPGFSAWRTSTRARMWRDCSKPSGRISGALRSCASSASARSLERLRMLAARLLPSGPRRIRRAKCPYARLAAEYRRADGLLPPLAAGGVGIVLLEAMAAGGPDLGGTGGSGAGGPGRAANAEYSSRREIRRRLPRRSTGSSMTRRGARDFPAAGLARVKRFDAPAVAAEFLEAIGLPEVSPEAGGENPSPRARGTGAP